MLFPCLALLAPAGSLFAQQTASGPVASVSEVLAEAPQPADSALAEPLQTPGTAGTQSSSSAQAAPPQSDAEKGQRDTAAEQLRAQEKQRVMGVMATFNTTSNKDALPLSAGQKFQLFLKSETDPWPFMLAGVVAGIGQAKNSYPEWGQGMQGYGKRIGGAYTDAFIGNFFGNAVLTTVLHEDPRYFQKGTGTVLHRILWAASSTVWCRRDNGKWGPNYANVGGNLIGAAIARTYYPSSERNVGETIQDGLTVSAEGIVGSEVIEFWPDIARHHKKKQAEKQAREDAQAAAAAQGATKK
jgi:hypothetical protein